MNPILRPLRLSVDPRSSLGASSFLLATAFLDHVRVLNGAGLVYFDVKMEHYGTDEEGKVKINDGGDLYFIEDSGGFVDKLTKKSISALVELCFRTTAKVMSKQSCKKDDDCGGVIKLGRCDVKAQR